MSALHYPVALLLALSIAGGAVSAAPADRPVRLPDGRTLNLWCDGRGAPAVIFDSGWSADSRAWRRVMAGLAPDHLVCAQDRAGSGKSDAGPLPRDGAAVAKDLVAALDAAGIAGPVVLVGHSLGALNMQTVAALDPERLAGMVLVDPSVTGVGSVAPFIARAERCLAVVRAGPIPDDPQSQRCRTTPIERAEDRWQARLSEIMALEGETAEGLRRQSAGSLAMPVIVLTAGRGREPAVLAAWEGLHRRTAAISQTGAQRTVAQSGHMMMFDAPDAIVAAVRDIVRMAPASAAGR